MNERDSLFDVESRVVVITGASSGLGESAARCFASRGARVALIGRRADVLNRLADEIPGAQAVPCDVTDDRHCSDAIDGIIADHGRIDVLINNAGYYELHPAESEPMSTFRRVLDTNLTASFQMSQLAARHMLAAGKGSIINVASIFGLVGSGRIQQASYAASKGGMINLTRELSAQWARKGIRVNAIAPAFFRSQMTADMWNDSTSLSWVNRTTPMGRPCELEELHGALVFLASDASSYITGVTLPVDGGWTAV